MRLNCKVRSDIVALVLVLLGASLIIMGLLFIILDSLPVISHALSIDLTAEFAAEIADSIPGIPLPMTDVAEEGATSVGIVTWIVGLDVLLVGLGVRNGSKPALLIATIIFCAASYFDLVHFMILGVIGSPVSVAGVLANGMIAYALVKLT